MPEVGFEPTRTLHPADLKSAPLDLSGTQANDDQYMCLSTNNTYIGTRKAFGCIKYVDLTKYVYRWALEHFQAFILGISITNRTQGTFNYDYLNSIRKS